MNSSVKVLFSTLLIILLMAGIALIVVQGRRLSTDGMPSEQATANQLAPVGVPATDAFQIDATLLGDVDLAWGAQGVYSDTWAADELNILTDEATIELGLLLEQGTGDAVTGYVDLETSLVFTVAHVISTTLAPGAGEVDAAVVVQELGPQLIGRYAGNQLNLTSERIAYTTAAGQDVQRQFRLTAGASENADLLTGEYRETVWGLSRAPLTVGGTFNLRRVQAAPEDGNRAPVANPQSVTTSANTAKSITLTASDADNDALSYTIVTDPTRGTLSGTPPDLTYTPNTGFAGSDSFTFRANDGRADSNSAAVTITVGGEGSGNRLPVAVDDSATTAGVSVTIDVLANDTDPDGDALTVTILQQPEHGSARVSENKIVYVPNQGYVGADTLMYIVTDGKGATDSATITITVEPYVGSGIIYLPIIQ